jgi:1-acyl-sn-glycerol-3-phosphate acyltransferase
LSGRAQAPRISPLLSRLFGIYLRWYFPRSFTAVRTSGRPPRTELPLIVYTNHPSWWDPIHFLVLARSELPGRQVYGPMDAAALQRYGFFRKLGVFGVERNSRRGAAAFLRTSRAILERPDASLWLTAEGRFTDPRERPVRLEPGLAHLLRGGDPACVVPLAIEYPFWNERRPEALSLFGEPLWTDSDGRRSTDDWTRTLEARLEETMDRLAERSRMRSPDLFRTVIDGTTGVGGTYDLWRRAKARLRGEPFHPAHGSEGS